MTLKAKHFDESMDQTDLFFDEFEKLKKTWGNREYFEKDLKSIENFYTSKIQKLII